VSLSLTTIRTACNRQRQGRGQFQLAANEKKPGSDTNHPRTLVGGEKTSLGQKGSGRNNPGKQVILRQKNECGESTSKTSEIHVRLNVEGGGRDGKKKKCKRNRREYRTLNHL